MYLIFQKHFTAALAVFSEKVYVCTMKCDFSSQWIICQQVKKNNQVELKITK